jgi:phosphoketolase
MSDDEVRSLFLGYGHEPLFVEGDNPAAMHRLMATALDKIRDIQTTARDGRAISAGLDGIPSAWSRTARGNRHRVAWAAVKRKYQKSGDRWIPREPGC